MCLFLSEVATACGKHGGDCRVDGAGLATLFLEDELRWSRSEGVVDADGLALGPISDGRLVTFPHEDLLWEFPGAPVVGVGKKLRDSCCFEAVADTDDALDGRGGVEQYLTTFSARRNHLVCRAVDRDDSVDGVFWARGRVVGKGGDLAAWAAEEVEGV